VPGPRYDYLLGWSEPPADVRSNLLIELSSVLSKAGYKAQMQTDGGTNYVRHYSPGPFWVLYVLFFPLGLLMLLARPTETLIVTYVGNSAGGTNITAAGTDKRMRAYFERLGAVDQVRQGRDEREERPGGAS
jgi:hypothetical protein